MDSREEVLEEMSEGWQERLKHILIFIVVIACFSFAFY